MVSPPSIFPVVGDDESDELDKNPKHDPEHGEWEAHHTFSNRLFLTCAATGFPAIAYCRIDTIRPTMEGLGGINGVDEATTIWVSMRAM